jgi:hypothetical protein
MSGSRVESLVWDSESNCCQREHYLALDAPWKERFFVDWEQRHTWQLQHANHHLCFAPKAPLYATEKYTNVTNSMQTMMAELGL